MPSRSFVWLTTVAVIVASLAYLWTIQSDIKQDIMTLPYIVVIGGSYVGVNTAQQLSKAFHQRFRVLLIEKNSHFQHLFAFPRFAVVTGVDTHRAFIPYTPGTFAGSPPGSGSVIQARVSKLMADSVRLEKKVRLDGVETDTIPYSFLVLATGTKLTPPSSLPGSEKLDGVQYLQEHAKQVVNSSRIVIIGGGAVGVQMATDIMQLYPTKSCTLVHSRNRVMHKYHKGLHELISQRCDELGVKLRLGSRVKLPVEGYPTDGRTFDVELEDGSKIPADFAIIATGQVPQSALMESLSPQTIDEYKFIKTRKTLQIGDEAFPNIFAVGDVAATAAHKAARPGGKQAGIVVANIQHLLNDEPLEQYTADPPGIHLTLGIQKSIIFRNPGPGSSEPYVQEKDDGRLDMNINDVWSRRGGGENAFL